MSQTADVPIPPDLSRRYGGSATGRDWLASLPRLIEQSLDRWQLELDLAPGALPWNGHGAIVVPVRQMAGSDAEADSRAGEPAVLKIAYPHDEALVEQHAPWPSGAGTGRSGCWPTTPRPVRCCWSAWTPTVPSRMRRWTWPSRCGADWSASWAWSRTGGRNGSEFGQWRPGPNSGVMSCRRPWERLGRPFPRWLLEAALEVCQTRGAVGRRSGKDVLVHTDLHYLNILARLPRDEPSAAVNRPMASPRSIRSP